MVQYTQQITSIMRTFSTSTPCDKYAASISYKLYVFFQFIYSISSFSRKDSKNADMLFIHNALQIANSKDGNATNFALLTLNSRFRIGRRRRLRTYLSVCT